MKKKKVIDLSLYLTHRQVEFLKSLSRRSVDSGGIKLSRSAILRSLIRMMKEVGPVHISTADIEDKILECLLHYIEKFAKSRSTNRPPGESAKGYTKVKK